MKQIAFAGAVGGAGTTTMAVATALAIHHHDPELPLPTLWSWQPDSVIALDSLDRGFHLVADQSDAQVLDLGPMLLMDWDQDFIAVTPASYLALRRLSNRQVGMHPSATCVGFVLIERNTQPAITLSDALAAIDAPFLGAVGYDPQIPRSQDAGVFPLRPTKPLIRVAHQILRTAAV